MTGGYSKAKGMTNLDLARKRYGRRAWAEAFQAFADADQENPLKAEDLEEMALAAYLIGCDDEYLKTLERAFDITLSCVRLTCPALALRHAAP